MGLSNTLEKAAYSGGRATSGLSFAMAAARSRAVESFLITEAWMKQGPHLMILLMVNASCALMAKSLGGFVVEVFEKSVSGSDIDCRRCGSGEMVLPAGVGEGVLLKEGL